MEKFIKYPIIILAVLSCWAANAQSVSEFRQLPNFQDLSSNVVLGITQDSQGFIWIGTEYGLNRFDGFHMQHYFRENAEAQNISQIIEDPQGGMWTVFGTNLEVAFFDRDKGSFRTLGDVTREMGMQIDWANYAYVDDNHHLWLASDSAFRYDFDTKSWSTFVYPQSKSTASMVSVNGDLFASTYEGIFVLKQGKNAFEPVEILNPELKALLNGQRQFYLYADHNNDLWGYFIEQPTIWLKRLYDKQFEQIELPRTNFLVRQIHDSRDGYIWVATDNQGIYRIDKFGGQTVNYCQRGDKYDVDFIDVSTVFCDNVGNIWAGATHRGLFLLTPSKGMISNRNLDLSSISALFQDSKNALWIGTERTGLYREYPKGNIQKVDIPARCIIDVFEDSKGKIWVGTFAGGFFCIDGDKVTHYTLENSSIPENNVFSITEDKRGNIWLGTLMHGLVKFDGNEFSNHLDGMWSVADLAYDKYSDILYVAGDQGLGIYNPIEDTGKIITANEDSTVIFPNRFVKCLNLHPNGRLWMGMMGGIVVMDPITGEMTRIDSGDGLPGNVVYSITDDAFGNTWITADKGIAQVRDANDHYIARAFSTFDGLMDNFHGAREGTCELISGELLFGCENGYDIINTSFEEVGSMDFPLFITEVLRNGEPLSPDHISQNGRVFEIKIPASYKSSSQSLQIDFSDFNYADAPWQQFFCRQDADGKWIRLTDNRLSFPSLAPGDYNIEIRKIDKNGIRHDDYAQIHLHVATPFWQSTWAMVIYILMALAFIFWLFYLYTKHRKKKVQEQMELEEAAQKMEMEEMKIRFFTNISHDLRTPLSLIISPLEELRREENSEANTKKIDMAYKNANHLLSLVNQLLEFRRLDVKADTLHISSGDIVAFVKEQYETFKVYADNNERNLTFTSDNEHLMVDFDIDKIKRVVYNLLSNALKFTDKKGHIDVSINVEDDKVFVSVADDGVGIQDEKKSRVFDRFYQVGGDDVHTGSGVGLHIAKEYISMHKGDIWVEDNTPKGSIFRFCIPIKSAVGPQEDNQGPAKKTEHERPVVLVVDDNPDFREFITDSLHSAYDTIPASNGAEALNLLDTNEVDIVVSDVMMPIMNGIELCQRIKNDDKWSHLPVIMITARTADEQKMEGLESGADDYITKPFSIDVLKLRISKFLDWRKKSLESLSDKIEIKPSDIAITKVDEDFVKRAIKVVEDNIGNADFSVEDFASAMLLSRTGLYRKLDTLTGKTPLEFIQFLRLNHGKRMLEAGMSVSETAYSVGYNQPKYFSRQFNEAFGLTPSEFRKKIKAQEN